MKPDWPLETERLALRPFEERDLDAVYRMQSDAEVARWLYDDPRTLDETRAHLARKVAGARFAAERERRRSN